MASRSGITGRQQNPYFWSWRNAFISGDQKALTTELQYSFVSFVVRQHLSKDAIACHERLADMRFPHEWFPATRAMQRTIHLHVGPTNSGKTYNALKALEESKSGIYAGPLRLLAHETYTRFKAKNKRCALITGEEQRIPEGDDAYFASCTVEMTPLNQRVDVAVIDEIQMIGDEQRGWAWTQAVLGVQAKEVHLCGEERAVPLVQALCAKMGDEVIVHKYKAAQRLATHAAESTRRFRQLAKGRRYCVVLESQSSFSESRCRVCHWKEMRHCVWRTTSREPSATGRSVFSVFVVSWVNPGKELAAKTFEDYLLQAVYPAIEHTLIQTGQRQVNAVGYCIGGTMLSCALAHMAAKGVDAVASATFFAAQQDFAEAGDLKLFTDEDWLRVVEVQMENAGGVLPGQAMAGTFNALRANDLIWSFFISNYLMGKDPKPFDLLFWNSDQTRMPKALHLFYLRKFYQDNALTQGQLTLAGERLDLSKVKAPVYAQSSREDHIAPARSVYRGARAFGGATTFTLAGSGHIAGVINHPDAHKYQHWTSEELPPSLDEWTGQATEHAGSWWPHWGRWLAQKSGAMVDARDPSKGPLKPIENAPGRYVKVKS